jgi:hypothetical protein
MSNLATYRTELQALLATAVDSSSWPNALLDQALRLGLADTDAQLVYEESCVVSAGGYHQDMSAVPGLRAVLALAYPWQEGDRFGLQLTAWRWAGPRQVVLAHAAPQAGETIRVRFAKNHTIADLDGAATTTVPDHARAMVLVAAAAWACDLRRRQLSENPALPERAAPLLAEVSATFHLQWERQLHHLAPIGALYWGAVGLN